MDAKESLCAVLEVLRELKEATQKMLVTDIVIGNASQQAVEMQLDELESFGIGEKYEEQHITAVIDQAVSEKYIKQTGTTINITAKGKKFLKAPVSFIVPDDDEPNEEPNAANEALLSHLVDTALHDDLIGHADAIDQASPRSRIRMQLIQAVDRKLALDDFAEQHGMEFAEVLDELELLISKGRDMDIRYFVDEVLGDECTTELGECFAGNGGDLERTIKEYGDVYQPEEIRLALIDWKMKR